MAKFFVCKEMPGNTISKDGTYYADHTYTLAKDYFEKLQVPIKGFYTFEQSAHSPLFEEPKKMQHILQEDVLLGENNLADTK